MTSVKRPLKVPLYPDDVLFFMHIPKTAGLSLISILDSYYPPEQIFPLHSMGEHSFSEYNKEELARYRLVRGHFRFGLNDNGIYQYLTPKPIIITMLRDPVQRTISAYRHQIRQKELPSSVLFEEFLTLETYHHHVYNRQTRFLVGAISGNNINKPLESQLSPEIMLHLAKERLEQIAFFGITERFRESMRLLSYTLSWQPIRDLPEVNRAPESFDMSTLSPDTLARLVELNTLDQEVYDYAQHLFEERYQQMIDELIDHEAQVPVASSKAQARTGSSNRSVAIGLSAEEAFLLNMRNTRVGALLFLLRRIRLKLFPRYSRQEQFYYKLYHRFFTKANNRQ